MSSHATLPCSAPGDQTTYGTNNVWIGYAYQGKNFDTYYGYINEAITTSPNFDESFGGDQVNYTPMVAPFILTTSVCVINLRKALQTEIIF